MTERKSFLTKPAGPSEEGWCNDRFGTTGKVLCETCGTDHPERPDGDDSYRLNHVLGLQVVDECCGKMIDMLYREWEEDFAIKFVREFGKNPLDLKFTTFRMSLSTALNEAQKNIQEVEQELTRGQSNLSTLNKISPLS